MYIAISYPLIFGTSLHSLAYAEFNYVLAALFVLRVLSSGLYETGEVDVKSIHDLIVPLPSLESKGFRVMFQ
ncbi:Cytochrome P472 monooxygenase [Paramyrothecium foliicola]|nr:Cytochrome P472 monooxygenase [Paramyrothecium foliicola]